MQSAEEFGKRWGCNRLHTEYLTNALHDRDAEWQARVDTLLEDNARSEEQVKKQFATAVSLKARAEKADLVHELKIGAGCHLWA